MRAFLLFASSLALVSLLATEAAAQGKDELRAALVGQEVVVLVDMPATKDGIDFHPERNPQVDYNELQERLVRYGISLREGETARITDINVKGKHIEFHLDGGGYGTFGDEGVPSTYVAMPPKSRRQVDLEERLRTEADPVERSRLQREIDRLEEDRRREHRRLQEEAEYRAERARDRISRARLLKGSRVNVRYDRDVPAQVQTPGGLMAVLSEYVRPEAEARADVAYPAAGEQGGASGFSSPSGPAPSAASPIPLRKGMTEAEVAALFGEPDDRTTDKEGSLDVTVTRYVLDEADVECTFVSGALVRFSIVSR